MDRDGFFKKGTCVASDKQGWKRLRRIYFALIKYTVDFYLKFNLNPNEKFIRLNPLNQLNPRSFSTHTLPYHHLSHHIFLQLLINPLNNGVF